MKILGINYLSESSVAFIENGELKYAISEERLNRVKNWWGNPFKAINYVLKETNNKIKEFIKAKPLKPQSHKIDKDKMKLFIDKTEKLNNEYLNRDYDINSILL